MSAHLLLLDDDVRLGAPLDGGPQGRSIGSLVANDRQTLGAILDDVEAFANLDDTLRAFEDELRSIGSAEASGATSSSVATVAPAVPAAAVADHVAALGERLERTFDLSVVDDAPFAGAREAGDAPLAPATDDDPLFGIDITDLRDLQAPSAPVAPPAVAPEVANPGAGIVSYASLAGDEGVASVPDELVPFALTPDGAMSPEAAAAKRSGRRRLVLLLSVITGLIAFVGLASVAAAHARAVDAAESVVAASTTVAPTTAAPPPTEAPTTVPTTEATTTVPPTTAPTTTAAPATTAATAPPTSVATTAKPTTTVKPVPTTVVPTTVSGYGFLDCVRARESRGDYTAMNPSGAHGAYQLMPVTARETALRAGRTDLAAIPVVNWSQADQDAMAAQLYQWQGAAPWGGGCAYPSN